MTEEMKDASKQAPRAMVWSVYIGAITGFIFLLSVCFCIGDINTVAETPTLVPLIQIYFDSTNSNAAACVLASLIVVIDLGCANALLAEGSRSLYAFARDKGLPFSGAVSWVEKKHQVPVVAVIVGGVVQMAFNSIYFGTVTGYVEASFLGRQMSALDKRFVALKCNLFWLEIFDLVRRVRQSLSIKRGLNHQRHS